MKRQSRSQHAGGKIKNIGPKSQTWLRSIGIESYEDLAGKGSVQTYLTLKETIPEITIVMLYALEAALWDLHWNDLPPEIKSSLHEQVGYVPPRRRQRREQRY